MDILVIGAGPSGLVMAGELARHGVGCRIVDRNEGAAKESRALGVQARTLQIFDSIGIADELIAKGLPMHEGHILIDGKPLIELDFTKIPGKYNYILSCPQSGTEQVLIDRLKGFGIPIERQTEVTGLKQDKDGVDVTFGTGETMRFDYVVGCDGAHSVVRRDLGLKFEGDEVPEGFILADVVLDWDRPEAMYLMANDKGFVAVFPLPGGQTRLILTAPPDEQGPVELEEVERMFADRSAYPATIRDAGWMSRFVIHERVVDRMQEGRCFVVGDAAHLHSPAGGQGMNTGIQDAHNLAWKLALVASGRADKKILATYNEERYAVDKQVVEATRSLLHDMAFGGPVVRWIRDHIAPHVVGVPFVQRKLMKTVSEQTVNYSDSDTVGLRAGKWADAGKLPGKAKHLLVGRDAVAYAATYEGLCEGRDGDHELQLVRPDGYVGALGKEALQPYFWKLGVNVAHPVGSR